MSVLDFQGRAWSFENDVVLPVGEALKDGSLDERYKSHPEVMAEIRKGYDLAARGAIYMQRLEFMEQGDDSPESFLERLKTELAEYASRAV